MKKLKNEMIRLQSLIECDRLSVGDSFVELVESDVKKLLKDYFDFRAAPKLMIEKSGDKFKIELILYADRIKNFAIAPKE